MTDKRQRGQRRGDIFIIEKKAKEREGRVRVKERRLDLNSGMEQRLRWQRGLL